MCAKLGYQGDQTRIVYIGNRIFGRICIYKGYNADMSTSILPNFHTDQLRPFNPRLILGSKLAIFLKCLRVRLFLRHSHIGPPLMLLRP
jgi:hypothetical protein